MSFRRRIYFISEHSNKDLNHGGIGPADIEAVLIRRGAIPVQFPFHFDFSLKAKLGRFYHLIKTCFAIESGSLVIFQHPLYARINTLLLTLLLLRKSVTIICLVADIDGIKDGNRKLLKLEEKFFRKFKYFILHNKAMEEWFKTFHPAAVSSHLDCFDFLTKETKRVRSKSNTIVFAGNLQKSGFLKKLDLWLEKSHSLHINLYGPGVEDEMLKDEKVNYKGTHHPYVLPDLLEGSFGLIWDGESIDEPAGNLGNYMRYISHHKLSLYIVSHLPVILHEKSGSAEMVEKLNIGFAVNNLSQIEEKINKLSEMEYDLMVRNSYALAKEITSGNCLQKALEQLITQRQGSSNS